jgi:hypothetical protein
LQCLKEKENSALISFRIKVFVQLKHTFGWFILGQ